MKMDVCQNVSISGDCKQEKLLNPSSSLDDLFSAQNMEVNVEMEWLSVFVEDCFSSPQSCVLLPSNAQNTATTTISSNPSNTTNKPKQQNESPFAVPGKARSKRKRLSAPRRPKDPLSILSNTLNPQNESLCYDPPLLKQTYWLADSELIVPKVDIDTEVVEKEVLKKERFDFEGFEAENDVNNGQNPVLPTRRCTHCLSQRTPQWRAGPLGPKTLCNACGVRYKSGRLLPEYRPAKSPTFVSYLHSNSHKKVMEMRMNVVSSIPSE
ncbi:GATA transcription factor 4-like [Vicia villosa]|uniref:GATA transcription factor 4-like n=1 Tax=Vicia villosa TaxID=3911 RepID=UPI00273BF5F2|nr:GATA transcription factor 4-like [Vicia villosa]